jgi:DNA repair protein RadC
MSITQWPAQERPREKLLKHGVEHLSDSELLAILLKTGCRGTSALALARQLLVTFGSLRGVITASLEAFCAHSGVGPTKYTEIQAAVEITRRHLAEPLKRYNVFHSAADVSLFLLAQLRDADKEIFGMLLLDSQHQLIAFRKLFYGTINSASVYPRELVKQALADNATAVILVHNHPSGNAEPSQADIQLTHNVKDAMALLDISVLDHFIVGDNHTVSLATKGLI